MLRRRPRSTIPTARASRSAAASALATTADGLDPSSADLLPRGSRRDRPARSTGALTLVPPARGLRRRSTEERAAHIRAMARAASRRAASRR